ncbi:MAG: hypothetical protein HXM45_10975 [Lautropia mirabilis]|nr:hypothetical protein [Lautropia mirabilis]
MSIDKDFRGIGKDQGAVDATDHGRGGWTRGDTGILHSIGSTESAGLLPVAGLVRHPWPRKQVADEWSMRGL